jgi:hypothetical protein
MGVRREGGQGGSCSPWPANAGQKWYVLRLFLRKRVDFLLFLGKKYVLAPTGNVLSPPPLPGKNSADAHDSEIIRNLHELRFVKWKKKNIKQASLVIRVFAIENSPLYGTILYFKVIFLGLFICLNTFFYMLDSFLSP